VNKGCQQRQQVDAYLLYNSSHVYHVCNCEALLHNARNSTTTGGLQLKQPCK